MKPVKIVSTTSALSEPTARLPLLGGVPIKYIALCLLIGQTVGSIMTVRMSRLRVDSRGRKYLSSTAVCMAELLKLLGSLLLVWRDNNYSVSRTVDEIHTAIFWKPVETLKVGFPAFLYTVQNNLIFIALSNMSGALYQVTYQLKIITTALLSVFLLRRTLDKSKWMSLFILALGAACVQIPTGATTPSQSTQQGNLFIGFVAVLSACFTSGFAGVYFEKILKTSTVSIWTRNIQLALYGSLLGLLGAFWADGPSIAMDGFFQGYTSTAWAAILFQSAGGLIVAAVLKYADNILKCFGNALAIVFSCVISYILLNDFMLSFYFFLGAVLVIFSTIAYGIDLNLFKLFGKRTGLPFTYQDLRTGNDDTSTTTTASAGEERNGGLPSKLS